MGWRPSDAVIGKAVLLHVLWKINIPKVDDHWASHQVPHAFQIQRAELFPFGHNDNRVGIFDAVVRSLTIGHVDKDRFGLLHSDWVIDPDLGTHVLQRGNQWYRGRLAQVIRIRLDVQPDHRPALPPPTPSNDARALPSHSR